MIKSSLLPAVLVLLAPFSYTGAVAHAQQSNTDSYIESLRADMHADKIAIITKAMNFDDKDAAVFWPIYKKYTYDLSKLDDQRVQLIKEYSQEFNTLTDAQAKTWQSDSLDINQRGSI